MLILAAALLLALFLPKKAAGGRMGEWPVL